jgi:hypothetical protein
MLDAQINLEIPLKTEVDSCKTNQRDPTSSMTSHAISAVTTHSRKMLDSRKAKTGPKKWKA